MKKLLIFLIFITVIALISFLIINFYFGILESKFNFKNF